MDSKPNDPVIDEVRAARHRISERFDHDPERLIDYYLKLQEQYQGRLIDAVTAPEHADPSAA